MDQQEPVRGDRPASAAAARARQALPAIPRQDRDRLHGELQRAEQTMQALAADFDEVIHRTCPDQHCGEMHDRVVGRLRVMLDSLAELDAILAQFNDDGKGAASEPEPGAGSTAASQPKPT